MKPQIYAYGYAVDNMRLYVVATCLDKANMALNNALIIRGMVDTLDKWLFLGVEDDFMVVL